MNFFTSKDLDFQRYCIATYGSIENLIDKAKKGDPKTLTPGPWAPLRTGSMDYLADRSADPLYGPPLKRIKK